eukprot:jgi/Chrzof1/3323/Cz12g20270.t1
MTSVCAGLAETVTFPIDMVKTQLQLQGQHGSSSRSSQRAASVPSQSHANAWTLQQQKPLPPRGPHLGAFAIARQILKSQGTRGLYAGLTPAVVRHVFYSGGWSFAVVFCCDASRKGYYQTRHHYNKLHSQQFGGTWAAEQFASLLDQNQIK